jgi:Domain of unknown function (DUF5658)
MTRPQLTESGRVRWDAQFARTDTWTGTISRRCVDLLVMLGLAAAVVDVATTYLALGTLHHVERNPVMRAAIDNLGLVPVLAVNLALRVAILVCLAYLAVRARRRAVRWVAAGTIGMVSVWWCVVVFANAVALGRA